MSVQLVFSCDGVWDQQDGSTMRCKGNLPTGRMNMPEATRWAQDMGWLIYPGRCLCPSHVRKEAQPWDA